MSIGKVWEEMRCSTSQHTEDTEHHWWSQPWVDSCNLREIVTLTIHSLTPRPTVQHPQTHVLVVSGDDGGGGGGGCGVDGGGGVGVGDDDVGVGGVEADWRP